MSDDKQPENAEACPECDGDGVVPYLRCCGKGHGGECCGDPDVDFEPCKVCGGKRSEGGI
jgi:hypothetical protein